MMQAWIWFWWTGYFYKPTFIFEKPPIITLVVKLTSWNHRMGPLYSTYILLFPGIPNPSLLSREFKSRIPTWTWTCQVQVEIRDFNPEVRKCTNEHSIIIMNSTSTKTKLWREYDTLQSELPMTIIPLASILLWWHMCALSIAVIEDVF